jgi:hypothetical protein
MLQFEEKKLSLDVLTKILVEIPGITKKQRIKDGDKQFVKGISFEINDIVEWIDDTLEISEDYKNKLGI